MNVNFILIENMKVIHECSKFFPPNMIANLLSALNDFDLFLSFVRIYLQLCYE